MIISEMVAIDELAPTFTSKPVLKQEDGGSRLVFESSLKVRMLPTENCAFLIIAIVVVVVAVIVVIVVVVVSVVVVL